MRITEVTDHVCSRIPFTKSKHANCRPPAVRWQGCKVSDRWWLLAMYTHSPRQLSPRSFHPRLDARQNKVWMSCCPSLSCSHTCSAPALSLVTYPCLCARHKQCIMCNSFQVAGLRHLAKSHVIPPEPPAQVGSVHEVNWGDYTMAGLAVSPPGAPSLQ